jgi:uncharacterized protein (TIGR00255 family)
MTGYGKGEAATSGLRAFVEIQSLNRKQIDIALNVPKGLQPLEPRIREALHAAVSRGRLNVTITVQLSAESLAPSIIDVPLARIYVAAMMALREELGLTGEITLDAVLRAPGIVGPPSTAVDPDLAWSAVSGALGTALEQLISMRETEGAHLEADMRQRLDALRVLTERITERAPAIQNLYRQQLETRVRAAGSEFAADDERIVRELILFADKSDITEELARLQSHYDQFSRLLGAKEPTGRTLEFLTQEISRELNTLSVKSNDAMTSQLVVECKTELERIREQIQNIE